MTNDELERVMNFIIERQERAAEQQAITAEQLAQAETILNALAQRQLYADDQLSGHNERIARFERSYTMIADLLVKHDSQLVALTDGLNILTRTVERYISEGGNGKP